MSQILYIRYRKGFTLNIIQNVLVKLLVAVSIVTILGIPIPFQFCFEN